MSKGFDVKKIREENRRKEKVLKSTRRKNIIFFKEKKII